MSSTSSGVGVALAAIAVGGAAGGAVICGALAAAYGLPRGADSAFADLAIGSAAAGLVTAGVVGFLLSRSLGAWRPFMAAIIAVSGAALVAAVSTMADMAAGRVGLICLLALCVFVVGAGLKLRPEVA